MKQKIKGEEAITLIVLVVTIIILLILAGVTIVLSLNSNSIINKADEANKMNEQSNEQEKVNLAAIAAKDYIKGIIPESALDVSLSKYLGSGNYELEKNEEGNYEVTILKNGNKYIVENNKIEIGNVENNEEENPPIEDNEIELTDEYIKIGDVVIEILGDIESYDIPQYGTTVDTGSIFKYSGINYYVAKDQPYLTKDNIDAFINNFCVELNTEKGFVTPGPGIEKGDMKLENDKVYVYAPYGDDPNGWQYPGWWIFVQDV